MSKQSQRKVTAFSQGKQARKFNQPVNSNPHDRRNKTTYHEWYHGWKHQNAIEEEKGNAKGLQPLYTYR